MELEEIAKELVSPSGKDYSRAVSFDVGSFGELTAHHTSFIHPHYCHGSHVIVLSAGDDIGFTQFYGFRDVRHDAKLIGYQSRSHALIHLWGGGNLKFDFNNGNNYGFFVKLEFRGRGFGKALISLRLAVTNELYRNLIEEGEINPNLSVWVKMQPNRQVLGFYENFGFRIEPRTFSFHDELPAYLQEPAAHDVYYDIPALNIPPIEIKPSAPE